MSDKYWRQKNGERIAIVAMGTNHIFNALHIVKKRLLQYVISGEDDRFKIDQTQDAHDALERELNNRPNQFDPIPTNTPKLFSDWDEL